MHITDFDADVRTLSGGQKKRVALAAALIRPVDLLLLDEPTNHIDASTIAWLEERLAHYRGALMMVTHDRYFLDRVCTRIAELDGGNLYMHDGNFSYYLEQKAARLAGGCPGTQSKTIQRPHCEAPAAAVSSQLSQWPVQIGRASCRERV